MSSTPARLASSVCLLVGIVISQTGCRNQNGAGAQPSATQAAGREQQVTRGLRGRLLTNTGAWSPDGDWLADDTRSDAAGEKFDGTSIEAVNIRTGEVKELYRSTNGACCGVVTWHPREDKVIFILGPEHPSADWQYCAFHRQGVIVKADGSKASQRLDARDLTPPFTPGALRGGSIP